MGFGKEGPPPAEVPRNNLDKESKHEKFVPSSVPKVEMDKQIEEGEQKEAEEKEAEVRKAREAREKREWNRNTQMRKQGGLGDITNSKDLGMLEILPNGYVAHGKFFRFRDDIDWGGLSDGGRKLSELMEDYEWKRD